MAKKKKQNSRKQTQKAEREKLALGNEIHGLVLILIGVLLFICLVVNQQSVLRTYITPFFLGLFGVAAYVVPFLLAGLGILRIAVKTPSLRWGRISLVFAIFLSLLGLLQIALAKDTLQGQGLTYSISLGEAYTKQANGMGLVTNLYTYPLSCLATIPGTIVIFIVLMVGSMVILFNFSLRETGQKVGGKVKETVGVAKERYQEHKRETNYDFEVGDDNPEEANASPEVESELCVTPFRSRNAEVPTEPEEEKPKRRKGITVRHYNQEENGEIPIEPSDSQEEAKEPEAQRTQEEYAVPPLALLNPPQVNKRQDVDHSNKIQMMESTLKSFGINAWVEKITVGPAITRYEMTIEKGTRVSRILNLSDDIALSMAATGVRIEAPIPGKSAIGIEIPNETVSMVTLREVLESEAFKNSKSKVSVGLGKDITGTPIITDLSKMPHLLIAGQTGSGKSVCINAIITSILYKATPKEVRLILVDPKKVELNVYNGIPHLLTPVVTDPKKAAGALQFVVRKMEERYEIFARKKVKDISRYNEVAVENNEEPMPRLVVIVDELNDLMLVARGEVEDSVMRIAQLARAAGIYLILATQRPSVNVITGVIKANIPTRIAFAVASGFDSKTILDTQGAEKLVGKGDMLYHLSGEPKPMRVQGAFVGEQEVERVVEFIKSRYNQTEYIGDEQLIMRELKPNHTSGGGGGGSLDDENEGGEDDLFFDAAMYAIESGNVSISALQRRFKVGYARAGRLIDDMELKGIVEPSQGAKARHVLMSSQEFLNKFNQRID